MVDMNWQADVHLGGDLIFNSYCLLAYSLLLTGDVICDIFLELIGCYWF